MRKEDKKVLNLPVIILMVLGIITLTLSASFIYFSVNGKDHSLEYSQKIESGEIKNPISEFGLTFGEDSGELNKNYSIIKIETEEGEKIIKIESKEVQDIEEGTVQKELVQYTSTILKLYNLHNIPFTTITPKIQAFIDKEKYFLEVINGEIVINRGKTENADIILKTNYEEIFKMIENAQYAKESFDSERTSIEKVENDFILFSKGYLTLYEELKKQEA